MVATEHAVDVFAESAASSPQARSSRPYGNSEELRNLRNFELLELRKDEYRPLVEIHSVDQVVENLSRALLVSHLLGTWHGRLPSVELFAQHLSRPLSAQTEHHSNRRGKEKRAFATVSDSRKGFQRNKKNALGGVICAVRL
jgi:hypothetical protein